MTDIGIVKEWFEDKLNLRNRIEVNIDDYYAYYYEKTVSGELIGNVSICKDVNKLILHTTTNNPITKKELTQMLENYLITGEITNDK